MRRVLLVPRRPDGGQRDQLWAYARRIWAERHALDNICEGFHFDGPFSRSAAVNTAAQGDDWDVALIADSDVVVNPVQARNACELALRHRSLVVAFNELLQLGQSMTIRIVQHGYDGDWAPGVANVLRDFSVGGLVAIGRELWDELGGMDERFRGWGMEDVAFHEAARTLGSTERLCGPLWHLWHQPGPRSLPASDMLLQRYLAAVGDSSAMRALLDERRALV